jgi:hypothetical protein
MDNRTSGWWMANPGAMNGSSGQLMALADISAWQARAEEADRILAITEADARERCRASWIVCLSWLTQEGWIAYPGEVLDDLKAEAARRYKP